MKPWLHIHEWPAGFQSEDAVLNRVHCAQVERQERAGRLEVEDSDQDNRMGSFWREDDEVFFF